MISKLTFLRTLLERRVLQKNCWALFHKAKNEREIMFHENLAIKNKQQKHPKVYFKKYLNNAGEPRDDLSNDTPPELEAELLDNSFSMKRRFRHIAQRMRNRYS